MSKHVTPAILGLADSSISNCDVHTMNCLSLTLLTSDVSSSSDSTCRVVVKKVMIEAQHTEIIALVEYRRMGASMTACSLASPAFVFRRGEFICHSIQYSITNASGRRKTGYQWGINLYLFDAVCQQISQHFKGRYDWKPKRQWHRYIAAVADPCRNFRGSGTFHIAHNFTKHKRGENSGKHNAKKRVGRKNGRKWLK